jgi:hypothetical protein
MHAFRDSGGDHTLESTTKGPGIESDLAGSKHTPLCWLQDTTKPDFLPNYFLGSKFRGFAWFFY